MFASSTTLAVVANLFIAQSLAAAVPAAVPAIVERDVKLPPNPPGYEPSHGFPASNPPGVVCYNTWETVTNDPVVQYWYVTASNVGNDIKADRVWNHLNLNGCAPTENKYYAESSIKGSILTFHTSEACTAARVSHAIRSGSEPGVNIACQYYGKNDDIDADGIAGAVSGSLESILDGLIE